MNKLSQLAYLILVLTLIISCAEKKSSLKAIGTSELVSSSKDDSLKFTSGIRVILQDSKGNYWLGSHKEGVCLFDGKSYQYFTNNEGLSDNQIRSIQEDKNGNIWFGDRDTGAWKYNGESMTNYTIDGKLKSQLIWDIYEDQNKNLLFATADGSVFRFDGHSFDKWF